jgi:pimeloyl-ACP methyl ester carboxylesterase
MYWAIRCTEPWARADPAEVARLGRGTYLGPTMTREASFARAVCRGLPHRPDVAGAERRVASPVPTLWIVGGDDPQDPLANVAGVERAMPNAKVVVVRYSGHGSVQTGCVPRLANSFVLRGSAAGLDPRCAARRPAPVFVLP